VMDDRAFIASMRCHWPRTMPPHASRCGGVRMPPFSRVASIRESAHRSRSSHGRRGVAWESHRSLSEEADYRLRFTRSGWRRGASAWVCLAANRSASVRPTVTRAGVASRAKSVKSWVSQNSASSSMLKGGDAAVGFGRIAEVAGRCGLGQSVVRPSVS
jgi:hypothetical protein